MKYLNCYSMKSKTWLVLHLFFCVEGMEVVVIGELSAAGDLLESKETDSVNPVHRPGKERCDRELH